MESPLGLTISSWSGVSPPPMRERAKTPPAPSSTTAAATPWTNRRRAVGVRQTRR